MAATAGGSSLWIRLPRGEGGISPSSLCSTASPISAGPTLSSTTTSATTFGLQFVQPSPAPGRSETARRCLAGFRRIARGRQLARCDGQTVTRHRRFMPVAPNWLLPGRGDRLKCQMDACPSISYAAMPRDAGKWRPGFERTLSIRSQTPLPQRGGDAAMKMSAYLYPKPGEGEFEKFIESVRPPRSPVMTGPGSSTLRCSGKTSTCTCPMRSRRRRDCRSGHRSHEPFHTPLHGHGECACDAQPDLPRACLFGIGRGDSARRTIGMNPVPDCQFMEWSGTSRR